MRSILFPTALLVILSFLTACVSTSQHSEFVKTVNFSTLDTFSYKHTLVTGMDFRWSDEKLLEDLSERTIVSELEARDFKLSTAEEEADFFVVAKWKKSVSSYVDPFDHIDPYHEEFARRSDPTREFSTRLHLTLEIYESSSGNLFWRKDLPNIFDAIQFTEERITDSLKRAIENFPQRIEKDPNLPSIQ